MIKTPIAKLFVGLLIALFLGSTLFGVASAASAPKDGCFDNGQPTTCPPDGTVDTNQNVMTPSTPGDCYAFNGPSPGLQIGGVAGEWAQVSCKDLTTLITSSAMSNFCGGPSDRVYTSIDLGCQGKGNAILDMLFAIVRLLSDGVGVVVIASVVVGGIQYTTSAGDPNAAAKAVGRIRAALLALVIFIFAYAILNYVLPGAFLK